MRFRRMNHPVPDARLAITSRLLLLSALLVLASCALVTADNGEGKNEGSRVTTQTVGDRGEVRLHAFSRDERLCLKLVRLFRADGRDRSDRWTSCGLPLRGKQLKARRRLACGPGEMQIVGIAPARTERLRARLDSGKKIGLRAYSVPAGLGANVKLFFWIGRRSEVVSLRAFDGARKQVDSLKLAPFRGPSPCR